MGLTIHYSKGRVESKEKIEACIKFLEDVAKRLPCDYHIIDQELSGILEDWNNPKNPNNGKLVSVRQKGIILLLDEGSEPLTFSFDYNTLEFCHYVVFPGDRRITKTNFFSKTQYSKNFLKTHHIACKLLAFVKKEYVHGLKVSDDGEYFNKWDKKHLQKVYEEWSGLMSAFGKALDNLTPDSNIEQSIKKAAEEVYKDRKLKKLFG